MKVPFLHQESALLVFVPKYSRTTALISLLISLLMGLLVSVLYFRLQPEVPLFYSLPRASEHLVTKEWLFLLPSISVIITITHLIIMSFSQQVDTLLLKLFAWSTVAVQLLLFVSLVRIILIIT